MLSAETRKEKLDLQRLLPRMKKQVAGEDYIEHEAVFMTDSEEEALAVAQSFDAELTYFEEGVATIGFDKPAIEVIEESAATDNNLQPVYPNYVYSIGDPINFIPIDNVKFASDSTGSSNSGASLTSKSSAENQLEQHDPVGDEEKWVRLTLEDGEATYTPYEPDPGLPYKKTKGSGLNADYGPPQQNNTVVSAQSVESAATYDGEYVNLSELLPGETYTLPEVVQEQAQTQAESQAIKSQNKQKSVPVEISESVGALLVSNDPLLSSQWFHKSNYDYTAWDKTQGSPSVIVAVIDTGISQGHEDLRANIAGAYSVLTDTEPSPEDYNGHGTHVSGIIAAVAKNSRGGTGVAPNVKILSIKALDSNGNGKSSYTIAAIYMAIDEGARVINLSLVGTGADPYLEAAIRHAVDAGIVVVSAAGNESRQVSYPAAFADSMAVSAIKSDGKFDSDYSNYGPEIDIAAPGTGIASTYLNNKYALMDGTSMACPMVSGAAALVYSDNLSWLSSPTRASVDNVRNQLENNASAIPGGGTSDEYGSGILNVAEALGSTGTDPVIDTKMIAPIFPVNSGVVDLEYYLPIHNMTPGSELRFTFDGSDPRYPLI